MSKRDANAFYVSVIELLWMAMFAASAVVVVHLVSCGIIAPRPFEAERLIVPGILVALASWYKRCVRVVDEGLLFGSGAITRWNQMVSAHHVLGPVVGLVITVHSGGVVVVAQSIAGDSAFVRAVRMHAPSTCPLVKALKAP